MPEGVSRQIAELEQRIAALAGTAGEVEAPNALLSEALQELRVALHDLNASQEEIAQNQAQLVAAQDDLARQRQRYYDLFMWAPDPYLVTDHEGIIRGANFAAAAFFVVAPESLLGEPLPSFVDAAQHAEFRSALTDLATGHRRTAWSVRMAPRAGEPREVEITAVLVDGTDEGAIRWQLRDVTERVRAAAEVRELNMTLELRVAERTADLNMALESAQAANEAKDEFLSHISHELRTPLTAIMGNARLLTRRAERRGEPLGPDSPLADIQGGAERLERVIENLMLLAQVEGRVARREPVPVEPFLHEVVAAFHQAAPGRHITVTVEPGVGFVLAQPTSLEEVLHNLLSNAHKYSPLSGPIEVYARREQDEVLVSVRDHGIGIVEEETEQIFDAFYRSRQGDAENTPGAGIGLAVSRRLIEAQGGRIWAGSWDQSGADVRFVLPAVTAPRTQHK